jgi:uncharacterized OB-fold protein
VLTSTKPDPAKAPPLLPDVDDVDAAPFWDAARAGRLVVQECGHCQTLRFPPRPSCSCLSGEATWREMSGNARIWSWCISHAPTLPAFALRTPLVIAVVELEESPLVRMIGNVLDAAGAPVTDSSALRVGAEVTVEMVAVTERVTLPYWRLRGGAR